MARILIVDDSEAARAEVRRCLESAGHAVMEAADGVEGFRALSLHRNFDLILCDINMPGMDGLTMCEKVRALPDLKHIPIFILTSDSSTETKAKGRQVGVTAWISKPMAPDRLLAGINKVLGIKGRV